MSRRTGIILVGGVIFILLCGCLWVVANLTTSGPGQDPLLQETRRIEAGRGPDPIAPADIPELPEITGGESVFISLFVSVLIGGLCVGAVLTVVAIALLKGRGREG